ncbi:MAG: efflux RND transporter periplasmic adaptor subunit [Bacteroidales bacterium]|nr:efflux RND transporter periplasmic adaptor subunit [Bacteroidales bacterium]
MQYYDWHHLKARVTALSLRVKALGLSLSRWFRRLTFKQRVWLGVGAVVLVTGLWLLLRARPEPPQLPVVAAEPIQIKNMEVYGDYVGRIRAQQSVEVRARVEGYLERMYFEEGTYVRQGQQLFLIDPKLYRARVEKAKAQLNKDKALAQKAERDLERIRPLYEQNAASRLDYDNAVAAAESAKAGVEMSEADLIQAEMALSYTSVRSPISGHVGSRNVDVGTLVGPGGKSLLTTVVKSDTVRVEFSMTGLDYLRSKERNVQLGRTVAERNWNPSITVTLPDNTVYPYEGLVDFADPQVDPKTGTFTVRAAVPNPDYVLLPGQITRVRLLMDVREDAMVVPVRALIIEKGGAYIFVVRPDSICEKRFIELGPEIGNSVIVERGIAPTEHVITEGYHKLTHGQKVCPTEVYQTDTAR